MYQVAVWRLQPDTWRATLRELPAARAGLAPCHDFAIIACIMRRPRAMLSVYGLRCGLHNSSATLVIQRHAAAFCLLMRYKHDINRPSKPPAFVSRTLIYR